VWGLGTLTSNYKGPRNGVPRAFPLPLVNTLKSTGPVQSYYIPIGYIANRGNKEKNMRSEPAILTH